MNGAPISLTTTEERESNPKAVFLGESQGIIHPLASYLLERSVDLYSGKEMNDAFFGDYFIYVGGGDGVKQFVVEEKRQLPKSLILLTDVSGKSAIVEEIKKKPQVKLVDLNGVTELTSEDTKRIVEFFLGPGAQALNLRGHEEVIPEGADLLADSRETDEELPPSAVTVNQGSQQESDANLAESTSNSRTDETTKTVQTFYDGSSPKPTGKNSLGLPRLRIPVFLGALLTLVVLVLFPVLVLGTEVAVAGGSLFLAKRAILRNNVVEARSHVTRANQFLEWGGEQVKMLQPIMGLVGQRELGAEVGQLFSVWAHLLSGGEKMLLAAEDGELLLAGISGKNKGVSHGALTADIKGNLALADGELGLAEAEFKTVSLQRFFERPIVSSFKSHLKSLSGQLTKLRQQVHTLKGGVGLLPELLGINGERTYLIVFQNNMELRPTGGFIGSFGLLTMNDGVIKDFTIEDVYAADGSLRGHVDPPPPLRDILGIEHWYMRDANWNPDFTKTGAQLKWFVEKELDVQVDGVIGVDVVFVEELLKVTDPVLLPDSKVSISSENLYTHLQSEVHEDFFPGSTKKRDILSELGRALTYEFLGGRDISWSQLAWVLDQSMRARHVLTYFISPQAQAQASEFGWAGEVGQLSHCQTSACLNDYSLVVDANLGVNKTNFFIKRSIKEEVQIDEMSLTHALSITYKNTATSHDGFGGNYKNYVRLFVPRGSELAEVTIDAVPLSLGDGEVASVSAVVVGEENGLTTFSSLIDILPQEEKTLTFKYVQPALGADVLPLEYAYLIQKQPGTTSDPYELVVRYPIDWKVVDPSVSGEVAGASTLVRDADLTYNSNLTEDQRVNITFSK